MTRLSFRTPAFAAAVLASLFAAPGGFAQSKSLEPFSSDRALAAFIGKLKVARREMPGSGNDEEMEEVMVTGARASSITNNQTSGVDEGGIVKLIGDNLVVLRRGRLFSVSIAAGHLRPVSWINAFGPGVHAEDGWYDEMLTYEDRIVVVGYNYENSATELNTFRIDASGALRYEGTWFLRSSDYYSSTNYASRLVGDKLIFYSALPLSHGVDSLPAMRKLPTFADVRPAKRDSGDDENDKTAKDKRAASFSRIVNARHVYRPPYPLDESEVAVLHTITTCNLSKADLDCSAVSAVGTYSEVFYVSGSAAYIWTSLRAHDDDVDAIEAEDAFVYRMPLDGSAPSALPVAGMPIDQFSFLEDESRNLNVLVASDGTGNWMWNAENKVDGSLALLRVPIARFGDGRQKFDANLYRALPTPGENGSLHNRFVNNHLLLGVGDGWGAAEGEKVSLFVTRVDGGSVQAIPMPHSIDRIEPMGADAVVIGTNEKDDLIFSGVKLGTDPKLAQRHVIQGAEQGELRSHGFFYRQVDASSGVFGLPIRSAGSGGSAHLAENSAGITYIYNDGRHFNALGSLDTEQDTDAEDDCVASCVDWYGNARPIFVEDRVMALLGYELVEGALRGGRIREIQRASFAPFFDGL